MRCPALPHSVSCFACPLSCFDRTATGLASNRKKRAQRGALHRRCRAFTQCDRTLNQNALPLRDAIVIAITSSDSTPLAMEKTSPCRV